MKQVNLMLGKQGIIDAYNDSLSAESLDVMCLSTGYKRIIGDYFEDVQEKEIVKRGIPVREILPKSDANLAYQKANTDTVRLIEAKGESDIIITDNVVTFISFDPENPFAIQVRDKAIIRAIKALYSNVFNS